MAAAPEEKKPTLQTQTQTPHQASPPTLRKANSSSTSSSSGTSSSSSSKSPSARSATARGGTNASKARNFAGTATKKTASTANAKRKAAAAASSSETATATLAASCASSSSAALNVNCTTTATNATTTLGASSSTRGKNGKKRTSSSRANRANVQNADAPVATNASAAPPSTVDSIGSSASASSATNTAINTSTNGLATSPGNPNGPTPGGAGRQEPPVKLPPAFRQMYLQNLCRQLQATHHDKDEAGINSLAATIELDIYMKSNNKNDYVNAINHEIHRMMQAEFASSNTSFQQVAYCQGVQSMTPHQTQGGYPHPNYAAMQQQQQGAPGQGTPAMPNAGAYMMGSSQPPQAPPVPQTAALDSNDPTRYSGSVNPGASMPAEGSFMQQLNSISPMYSSAMHHETTKQQPPQLPMQYSNASVQKPPHQQPPPQQRRPTPAVPTQPVPVTSSPIVRTPMTTEAEVQQKLASQVQQQQQQTQQQLHQQRMMQQQMGNQLSFQDFSQQAQQFTKEALIQILWNHRNLIMQWQRRSALLESRLMSLNANAASMGAAVPGTPAGAPSGMAQQPMYTASPRNSTAGFDMSTVSSNLSTEAEIHRANERRNVRMMQQEQMQRMKHHAQRMQEESMQQATQGHSFSSQQGVSPPQSQASNAALYWERVRKLRAEHEGNLRCANEALKQHMVPENSEQFQKVQSVIRNIGLALGVITEIPRNSFQPRPLNVLDSIEKFVVNTIVPIVQRVSQNVNASSARDSPVTSSGASGRQTSVYSAPSVNQQQTQSQPNLNAMRQEEYAKHERMDSIGANRSQQKRTGSPMMQQYQQQSQQQNAQRNYMMMKYESAQMNPNTASGRTESVNSDSRQGMMGAGSVSAGMDSGQALGNLPSNPERSPNRTMNPTSVNANNTTMCSTSCASATPSMTVSVNVNSSGASAKEEDNLEDDFVSFPELDFSDEMCKPQDSPSPSTNATPSAGNKENTSAFNSKKRQATEL